jgi:microcystin-dependent protein
MGQPYVGEIRMFAGSFAPSGWMFCAGQVIPISEYDTLFNLIGTTYGGDGEETFCLPNLCGRVPIHMGLGPGLPSNRQIGESAGVETTTLTVSQTPAHSHTPIANATGSSTSPSGCVSTGNADMAQFAPATANVVAMATGSLQTSGGSQPHENMMPYLAVNYIISLYGIYPQPS